MAKAACWTTTDAEARKRGEQTGLDYCWWPQGASAASFTIGSSYGLYIGGDYYHCIN